MVSSAELGIRMNRPKDVPKFKNFVLIQELEKRGIASRQFALALKLPAPVVRGAQGYFPLDKVDECIDLLNNWTGPISHRGSQSRPGQILPVSREMLVGDY